MRVLLTGVGGFIGAHCLEYWLENTDWEIIGLDSFRHKGTYSRLLEVFHLGKDKWDVFCHNLTVPIDQAMENLLLKRSIDDRGVVKESAIDVIVNMASDSAVERSTTDPTHCLRNNYELMINMLEFARKVKPKIFIQISTDEVYGEAPSTGPGHQEWATIMPSNPYAASKAAQEALAISYWRTYDVPVVLTNCMNIIGERQDKEKFLPRIIECVAKGQEIPIYADKTDGPSLTSLQGHGGNYVENNQGWYIGSRIYLDARNKADALKFITRLPVARYSQGAKIPDRYNICGDTELNNLELAKKVAVVMGKELKYKLVPSESARPGYDRRYALDGSKLRGLGWQPPYTFDQTLERIVRWTLDNQHWVI